MKLIILLLVALSGVCGYLYFSPNSWPEVWQAWVKGTPLESAPSKTQLYKWQDENGQWQITDRPPEGGTLYENLEYRSDTNIVPSISLDD